MKTIITTVGTSLFENYMRTDDIEKGLFAANDSYYESIKDSVNRLKNEQYSSEDYFKQELKNDVEHIKTNITQYWFSGINKKNKEWVFEEGLNEYACAEIESILAIVNEDNSSKFNVYLFSTDTVLSVLATELIKTWFDEKEDIDIHFNQKKDIIKDLRIDNLSKFREGLINLNTRYYQIAENYILAESFNNLILNITGGYKGIIPYLTILGQVNKSQIKYLFEDTNTLITIPQVPIQIDEQLFEKYWKELTKIENNILNKKDYYELFKDLESCFEIDSTGDFMFNYLGNTLWNKYKKRFFTFYSPDDTWEEIQKEKMIYNIIVNKLSKEENREGSKNVKKNDKKCYDDGDNTYRLYNLKTSDGKFVIYKVFVDHKLHEEYINKKVDFESIIKASKLRRIEISK